MGLRIRMFENQWQKRLDDKGDYTKPLDVKSQVKPLAAAIAQESSADPVAQKNVREALEIAIDSAADKLTGKVSVKDLGSFAETMDVGAALTGARSLRGMKDGTEALIGVLITLLNKDGVPTLDAAAADAVARPEHHAPISVEKLMDHLDAQLKAGRLDRDAHDRMFIAAHLASKDDGKTVTIAAVEAFATEAKDLADMFRAENDRLRSAGLKPNLDDLKKEASMAGNHLGALRLSQLLLHSAISGELAALADAAKPGATAQLGSAFGGARP